jgi:hypothetical protein
MNCSHGRGRPPFSHRPTAFLAATALALLLAAGSASAQDAAQVDRGTVGAGDAGALDAGALGRVLPSQPAYSPHVNRTFPTRPLFGDTHLHTSFSLDAGAAGARLTPRDAYRFARGEQVTSSTGLPVQLSRPLDFLVVADHSDQMGFFSLLLAGDPAMMADPTGRRWYDMIQSGQGVGVVMELVTALSGPGLPPALSVDPGTPAYRSAWRETIAAAEEANDPGRFTAFIGYEWTSQGAFNIHRNVIFRDGGDRASMVEPFTTVPPLGSPREPDLWRWMADYEARTGGEVLAIPHNGNLSNGLMFALTQPFTDVAIDQDYVEARARWEPLYEVTQTKGDGETHPFLSPNDEFADFETWDKGNLDVSEAKDTDMLRSEYARSALRRGLQLEEEFGTNPFKFGMAGGTDSHTGLTAVEEDNFFGKVTPMEPNPERLTRAFMQNPATGLTIMEWEVAAAGYTAVWARENTREAIFDAMKRRETYATTGSRMIVRLFGGYDFAPDDATSRSPAIIGYSRGVPMGGDLHRDPEGRAPTFLVAALRDPIGANLDRYQIVKGWMDADGETHEEVYDVAWSDDREPGDDGRLPPVGSTVDVEDATWLNTIGAPELIAVWEDPDFDPEQKAFYYGRVLEIPTPRWTAYDAKYFGTEPEPGTEMELQERAYTSPIWYSPD